MDGADVTRVDASISPSVFLATLQTWRSYVVETDCYHTRTEPPQKKAHWVPLAAESSSSPSAVLSALFADRVEELEKK